MRVFFITIVVFFLFANCEKPSDCIKSSGPITSIVYQGITFDKILVRKRIAVVITQGEVYKVEVQAGENLINDIDVYVDNNTLILEDKTTCNWVREFGKTIVYITTPTLTEITCKTEQSISSNGILSFPNLHLFSLNSFDNSGIGTGDFILNLDCENLVVENNDVSRYFLKGKIKQLNVNFYEGDGIFHGEEVLANTIYIYHRGSNDMFLNPLQSISGDIYNVGNVFCYSKPSEENTHVTQHYRGKLIYK